MKKGLHFMKHRVRYG